MRKFYFLATTILLSVFSLFMYLKNTSLETQIEETNKRLHLIYTAENAEHIPNSRNLIIENQFKDNLILNQLNNTTAIMLSFVAIIIAATGFISFKNFDQKIKKVENETSKIKELEIKTELNIQQFNELKEIATIDHFNLLLTQKDNCSFKLSEIGITLEENYENNQYLPTLYLTYIESYLYSIDDITNKYNKLISNFDISKLKFDLTNFEKTIIEEKTYFLQIIEPHIDDIDNYMYSYTLKNLTNLKIENETLDTARTELISLLKKKTTQPL